MDVRFRILLLLALLLPTLAPRPLAQVETPRLVIETGGHMAPITGLEFFPGGRALLSVSRDKTVRVWDVASGDLMRTFRGQTGPGKVGMLFASALSPDGQRLALGGHLAAAPPGKGAIRILDAGSGEVTAMLFGHGGSVTALAFSSGGKTLISGSRDNTVRLWEAASGRALAVLKGHRRHITAVAISRHGGFAASASKDRTARLWKLPSGRPVAVLAGHADFVRAVAFTPDGRYLLTGSNDRTVRLWDGRTGRFIKILARQQQDVVSISISPDGGSFLTGGFDRKDSAQTVSNVFRIPSGEKVIAFGGNDNTVLATAFSPDGTLAATGGGSRFQSLLWEPGTGKVRRHLVGMGSRIWSVGFSRDGSTIAWGKTYKTPQLFNRGPLEHTFRLRGDFSLDAGLGKIPGGESGIGRGIFEMGDLRVDTPNHQVHKTFHVMKGGKIVHRITRDEVQAYDHRSLTLTPDGRTVIGGSGRGMITAYDVKTGRALRNFIGHTAPVVALAPSPDGRWLVSGSADRTIRIWAIRSGKLLLTIFHGDDDEWVAWIPEGYYAASVNGDRYIGWHINRGLDKSALYFSAYQFSGHFYYPQVVAHYLETEGDIDEALRRANARLPPDKQIRNIASADLLGLLPPRVAFRQQPGQTRITKAAFLSIDAYAESLTSEPIEDIWLLVNGRKRVKSRGIKVQGKGTETPKVQQPVSRRAAVEKRLEGRQAFLRMEVPLVVGENRIAVVARNRHATSEPEVIVVVRKAPPPTAKASRSGKPVLYILAVGISEYANTAYNLAVAHADAEAITALFKKQAGKIYQKVEARLLLNGRAGRDDILNGLEWLHENATKRDTVLIFLAGHGLQDRRGNYYFVPYHGDARKLRTTAVRWAEFQELFINISSNVIMMTDTCQAGAITGGNAKLIDLTETLRRMKQAESNVIVMAASTATQESQERPEWGHGAFTKALLEGFGGRADRNGDGAVDLKEINFFVGRRVRELTGGEQTPTTVWISRTTPNFKLVVN